MTTTQRRGQWLYIVVAVLAIGWVIGFILSVGGLPTDPPPALAYFVMLAVTSVVVAAPWMVAVRLLQRARLAVARAELVPVDAPARLLAAAVRTLPDARRDWGAAMTAELAQVPVGAERWRFAVGSARAAMFPPRLHRVPVIIAGVFAAVAVIVAGLGVGDALPALGVFVVSFVGLVGALAVVATARSRRIRPAAGVEDDPRSG